MNGPELTVRSDPFAASDGTVRPDQWTLSGVHRAVFDHDGTRESLIQAIRVLGDGRTAREFDEYLGELGVDALDGAYRDRCRDVALGDPAAAWEVLQYTRQLGTGHSPLGMGFTSPTEDIRAGALPILRAADVTPSISVVLGDGFTDARASDRKAVVSFLVDLASACDVAIVPTDGIKRTFLWKKHGDQLPASVESQCNPRRDSGPTPADVDEKVSEAIATIADDSTPASYVRELGESLSETLTYGDLERKFHVSRDTVRTHVTETLVDLELVERVDWYGEAAITLTHVGEEYLSTITRQSGLFETAERTPQHGPKAVCTRAEDEGGDGRGPYRTEYLSRSEHTAAVACAPSGGVGTVKTSIPPAENDRIRWVSHVEDRNEGVVAVRASTPYQYTTSTAIALTSPRFFDKALPIDRLEAIDDPPEILRDARCCGWLSDDALDSGAELRDTLVERGEQLERATTKHERGEYEPFDSRDAHRSFIMREAHGLAGTVVHLLDVVGVDLTREIRVPGGIAYDDLEELAKAVGISAAIQSAYGKAGCSAYRQLFEDRENKRIRAITPTVDAADPTGELIGSFVFRGPDIDRFRPSLEERLSSPRDAHEDAPEFAVPIPIRECGREAVATAATRVLKNKNMKPTRDAVALFHGFVRSPYTVARALSALAPEERRREVRPDEVRYALATLDTDDLLPELPPTVGKVVMALLTTDERLSKRELADRADVSTESLRRHSERLSAFGFVDDDRHGYRLELSFQTPKERRQQRTPEFVGEGFHPVRDVVHDALAELGYLGDPEVAGVWTDTDEFGVPDVSRLADVLPWIGPWLRVLERFTGESLPANRMEQLTVRMGPSELAQQPIHHSGSGVSA